MPPQAADALAASRGKGKRRRAVRRRSVGMAICGYTVLGWGCRSRRSKAPAAP